MSTSTEVLEERLRHLTKDLEEVRSDLDRFRSDAELREKRNLIAGISILGSVALSLIGIIWSYRGVIFK